MRVWLEQNAAKAFWALFFIHFIAWTIIPTLIQPNAPLDVIEGLAWGNEWPLGTYKHPPLQAWLLESATYLFGTSGLGYFGLSALCGALTLWAVWKTALLLTNRAEAFLAALLTQSIFYVNLLSTEFNPNVLQLVLAALTGCAFMHALIKGDYKYWIALGALFALGLYAKYSFLIFGINFVLSMLAVPQARSLLFRPASYMALITATLLFMPQFLWLVQNHFLPLHYATERLQSAQSLWQQAFFPIKFIGSQLLAMLAVFWLVPILVFPFTPRSKENSAHHQLLFWLAFGPLLLALAYSLFSGNAMRDMWGMPLLTFIPLWLIMQCVVHARRLKLFIAGWSVTALLCLCYFCAQFLIAPSLGFKPMRGQFPGQEVSNYFHQQWQAQTGGKPLHYVIGDAWMAGNVAFYAPTTHPRPHVWIDGSLTASPWIRREQVKNDGAIAIWRIRDASQPGPPPWAKDYHSLNIQPPVSFNWHYSKTNQPLIIGWGIIRPE